MNCAEFQKALPEHVEPQRDSALRDHLSACHNCSNLVSELENITAIAPSLADSEEPDQRLWLQLESALKNEGLIRPPQPNVQVISTGQPRRLWSLAWAVPAIAALVVVAFVAYGPRSQKPQLAQTAVARVPTMQVEPAVNRDDQELLEVIGSRSPSMQAEYAANLKNVNAYIRDAEETAKANPADEQAQESVMNAYEQRSMVYEMAMDHSLP